MAGGASAAQATAPMATAETVSAGPTTVVAFVQAPSGEELEAMTREVSSELRCVVCQGVSIEDSPSELAREMKDVVRDQLAAGRTPDQVKQYFVDTYGEWILLEPEPTGFNLAVYLLPVLALVAGAVILFMALRRWSAAGVPAEGGGVAAEASDAPRPPDGAAGGA
ncbi:MAG: cytochrome c-type biogenesis protein [Gemmatimonadota bacterium]